MVFSLCFVVLNTILLFPGDLRSQNRCPAKACTNRILVQPRSSNPTTGSPTKDNSGGGEVKKNKGRCGECEGCKVNFRRLC